MSDEKPHSEADKIAGYSYLHLFAHDGVVSDAELSFLRKLALRDTKVDDAVCECSTRSRGASGPIACP